MIFAFIIFTITILSCEIIYSDNYSDSIIQIGLAHETLHSHSKTSSDINNNVIKKYYRDPQEQLRQTFEQLRYQRYPGSYDIPDLNKDCNNNLIYIEHTNQQPVQENPDDVLLRNALAQEQEIAEEIRTAQDFTNTYCTPVTQQDISYKKIERSYILPSDIISFLKTCSLNNCSLSKSDLEIFQGTIEQHELHSELINRTQEAANLYNHNSRQLQNYALSTANYIYLACQMNSAGELKKAYDLNALCKDLTAFDTGILKACDDNLERALFYLCHPELIAPTLTGAARQLITNVGSSALEFLLNPQTDEVYQKRAEEQIKAFSDELNKMPWEQKLESIGYITADLVCGHYTFKGLSYVKSSVYDSIRRGAQILQDLPMSKEIAYTVGLAKIKGINKVKRIANMLRKNPGMAECVPGLPAVSTTADKWWARTVETEIRYAEGSTHYAHEFVDHQKSLTANPQLQNILNQKRFPKHFIPAMKGTVPEIKVAVHANGTKFYGDKYGNAWFEMTPNNWFVKINPKNHEMFGFTYSPNVHGSASYNITNAKKLASMFPPRQTAEAMIDKIIPPTTNYPVMKNVAIFSGEAAQDITKISTPFAMAAESIDLNKVADKIRSLLKPDGQNFIASKGTGDLVIEMPGSINEAEKFFYKLTKECKLEHLIEQHPNPKCLNGFMINLPDKNSISFRPISTSGPPTIEIMIDAFKKKTFKIKFITK